MKGQSAVNVENQLITDKYALYNGDSCEIMKGIPDMSEDEIRVLLFQNINEIAPVTGMNNHEGSLITANAEQMSYVMKACSDEGIYFLDSRTNVETKVPYVARELGYSYYERRFLLDVRHCRLPATSP